MKTSETEAILLAIFSLGTVTSAVLTGYEQDRPEDITGNVQFGCVWLGGNSADVKCTCRDDAPEMYIQKNSIPAYDTASIEITNCKSVRFGSSAVEDMQNLRRIHLKDIASLKFEEKSFTWYGYRDREHYEERSDLSIPSLKFVIENCNIDQIASYTFQGRINTIYFDQVNINNIYPFAFNALMQNQRIIIKNSRFNEIRLQAFKKFTTEILEFDGVTAPMIPSRFISNLTVFDRFTIRNCTFDVVRPGAFLVFNPLKFEVIDTRINHLDGEAFKVTTHGDAIFRNNVFHEINDGAFSAIRLSTEESTSARIIFDSNYFSTLTRDSLSVSDTLTAEFSNLNINETCDCRSIDHKIKDSDFYAEIKCLNEGQFVTVKEYSSEMCSLMQSHSTPIIIGVVVFALLVITGIVLMVYYRKVYLSRKYGNDKNSNKKNGNLSLIVPDGRTYRETELHVIVERADLLTTDL